MSFSTIVEIEFSGESEGLDIEPRKENILNILSGDGVHEDVYINLVELFQERKSHFNLHPAYCFELLEKVSSIFPEADFSSRGLGDEYIFTWVSLFENGSASFKNLAWENENPFV